MPGTPATAALDAGGVAWRGHVFVHRAGERHFGDEAAAALGIDAQRVFKTLVIDTGAASATAVVPVSAELDLRAAAAAIGAKTATMAGPRAAARRTGYVVGGISPLGQRTPGPVVVDASAFEHATVFVSGGRRGFDVELSPADLVRVTGAVIARILR